MSFNPSSAPPEQNANSQEEIPAFKPQPIERRAVNKEAPKSRGCVSVKITELSPMSVLLLGIPRVSGVAGDMEIKWTLSGGRRTRTERERGYTASDNAAPFDPASDLRADA